MDYCQERIEIALITPAYNNADLIYKLYKSLENNSYKDFIWIIVNDGSKDNTIEMMGKIQEEASFEVRVITKENGGKCRAINQAFRENQEFDFYMIVDSDESILEDAIEKLHRKVHQYLHDESVGAIYFWREMKNSEVNQRKLLDRPEGDRVLTIYERITDGNIFGDGAIGYYNRFLSKYQFREFPEETFIGEITLLQEAALNGYAANIVYVDIVFSIGEYSPNGLSAQGRRLRIQNPYGMIYYSGMMQSKKVCDWKIRFKYAVSAQAYASISKITQKDLADAGIHINCLKIWAKFPGWLLGGYWKRKYAKA